MAGRNITDNVVVAFEVIHHMGNKMGGQEGEIALKLDVSKAYDRVNWKYLQKRMVSLGFSQQWTGWIMRCVTTVSYEFCFNGMIIGHVTPRRGLRQGVPFLPICFYFVWKAFRMLWMWLQLMVRLVDVESVQMPLRLRIFYLPMTVFFSLKQIRKRFYVLLSCYAEQSGQAINFQKSGIFFSSNVRRDKQLEFSGLLGVHNDISTSNYLGLPSLIGRSKKMVFGFLKDKIRKRIQAWGAKPISRAGKTILFKNVSQSIPSYCMSCFLLPKMLCQEMERILNNYW